MSRAKHAERERRPRTTPYRFIPLKAGAKQSMKYMLIDPYQRDALNIPSRDCPVINKL